MSLDCDKIMNMKITLRFDHQLKAICYINFYIFKKGNTFYLHMVQNENIVRNKRMWLRARRKIKYILNKVQNLNQQVSILFAYKVYLVIISCVKYTE